MAQVFLALSGELSGFRRLVVVKRILPHLASDRHFIQMFFDEARLAALLDHPNIVRIIEVGQEGSEYFLAMEAVQGRSLSSLLRRALKEDRPLTHAQSAFVIAQVANGLGHAHNLTDADGRRLEVVHRDVSPQNILVSFEGNVKVIDFGVARALGRVTETQGGGLKGKIHYMSPEQVTGGHVDRRSDVFALGIVLWEALCGRRLFKRSNELATLRAVVDEAIPFPSEFVRISPRLERIVMRALEKDPADRFKTAEEMALALERHAFTTEGFNPLQLGTAMKSLFAADHARWRKTMSSARNLEGRPEQWANTSGTFLRPQTIDLQTRGPTVMLRPPETPTPASVPAVDEDVHHELLTDTPSGFTRPSRTRPGRHLLGGIGLSIVAALGVFAFSPSLSTVQHRSRGDGIPAPVVAEPVRSKTGAPVHANTATSPPTAPDRPLVEPVPAVATTPAETAAPEAEAAATAPFADATGTEAEGAAPVVAIAETTKGDPTWERPPRARPRDAPVRAMNRVKLRPTGRTVTTRASRNRRVAAATSARCKVTLGTRPWSEVWIDGRNTGIHTPYSGEIECGKHRLTFRRPDVGLSKSYAITVYKGEPFKQSFSLD